MHSSLKIIEFEDLDLAKKETNSLCNVLYNTGYLTSKQRTDPGRDMFLLITRVRFLRAVPLVARFTTGGWRSAEEVDFLHASVSTSG